MVRSGQPQEFGTGKRACTSSRPRSGSVAWIFPVVTLLCAAVPLPGGGMALAQPGFDPAAAMEAQRKGMEPLAIMDGIWRGEGWTTLPSGEREEFVQTERCGTMLDGTVRVVEGRGYDEEGNDVFQAFAVIRFDNQKGVCEMSSHAMGHAGVFEIRPTGSGFVWEIPAGPMTIRYTATIEDGVWREIGERVVSGAEPVLFHEMVLHRIGDTDWPSAGAIGPE